MKKTINFAVNLVKEQARKDTWCTAHSNCFRGSLDLDNSAETEEHLDKKYALWKEYRRLGCTVFTELILSNGLRPDLIICYNNGDIEIIEVVNTEKEGSILKKKRDYPFKVKFVRVGKQ